MNEYNSQYTNYNQGQPQGFTYQEDYNGEQIRGFKPQNPPYNNYMPVEKNPTLTRDIILSILQGVLMAMWITAIISFIFTLVANDRFSSHLYAEYEKYTKYGRITRIIGCIIFALFIVLMIVGYVLLAWTFMTMG